MITKFYNDVLNNKLVKIELNEQELINAEWIGLFSQPGLYRFIYRIINS